MTSTSATAPTAKAPPRVDCCELADLASSEAFLTALRRQLHQQPELSLHEVMTAELVASSLAQWGFRVTRNVGGHGVVGTLERWVEGGDQASARRLMLRADMDALPIEERGEQAWRSRNPGVMHACGHDGHTTMLLGAARHLALHGRWHGTLHLLFQHAEEGGNPSGAPRLLADGLFERFPCDAIFGLHNHPGLPAGVFAFGAGPFMSASDTLRITLLGKGGHAARPHLTVDPVLMAGHLVVALQSIVARNVNPQDIAIVTVGSLHAGSANNVIPEKAELALSVRSFNPGVRQLLRERIHSLTHSLAQSLGGSANIEVEEGYPVLVNDPEQTAFAHAVAVELVGAAKVHYPFGPVTGSEDFAYFLQHKPGCFFRLGNGETSPALHTPSYDFNDANLSIGAAFWCRLTERYLVPG